MKKTFEDNLKELIERKIKLHDISATDPYLDTRFRNEHIENIEFLKKLLNALEAY